MIKKKFCIISPKSYPLFNSEVKSPFGGAEVQLFLLSKELSKEKNLEMNFIVADYGQDSFEKYNNINIWKGLNLNKSKISQLCSFLKVLNRVNADVYIQRTLTNESWLIGLYCRLRRKKFVYMVAHDGEVDGTNRMYNNFFTKIFARLNFLSATKIIVQNEYEKNFLKKKFRSKVHILKKGLKLEKTKIKADKRYDAVWVGRCKKYKRPKLFLDIAQENKDCKFLMICSKSSLDPDYFEHIKNLAEKLKNVEFLDFVNNEDIYKYLSESKLYIFTSTKEGDWPMVVLEAAASKLPILSYDLNYDDLIDKYGGGILCKGDFDLMNRQFRKLIDNEDERNKLGENGYRYIMDNHNIETNAKNFLKIITNEKK